MPFKSSERGKGNQQKPDFQITILVRKICLEGGKLTTLTDNSILSYAAHLCKEVLNMGGGGEIVERALKYMEERCMAVQDAHDSIYSAAGICKEWTDTEETNQDRTADSFEGMSGLAKLLGLAKVNFIKGWLTQYHDARAGKGPVSVEILLEQLYLHFINWYPFESTLEDAEKHYPQEQMLYKILDWLDSVPTSTTPVARDVDPNAHENGLSVPDTPRYFSSPLPSSSPPLPSSPLPMTPPAPVPASSSWVCDCLGDILNPLREWIKSMYGELEGQPKEDSHVEYMLTDWQGYEMGS
ncbi:hypothetical protein EDD18DRAFT_1112482 [Armillaria luteobubalina]|uniref:Uncharacterized protein n=1 Tax=Armillaria luteobubalina TaxID=153913 RepID=A0AA39UB71_9AGAR|nr:hypothetical protein EDD18DRAFT_1112482 [Armillaria luteobubalina]